MNDLGGDRHGNESSAPKSAADKVVAEICSKGGQAVPNYDRFSYLLLKYL